jgi:HK97 family phage portal protein
MLAGLSRVLGAAFRASPENPSTNLANPAQWLLDWVSGGSSSAGIAVTEDKALGVPVAYACTRVLANTIATLPLHVFEKKGRFGDLAPDHWAQPLLAREPNPLHTAFVWRELMMVHALLWGNHYSAIDIDARGEVVFLPLLPWNTDVRLTSDGRRKFYRTRLSDGSDKDFREDRVIHVPAMGTDGLTGISPVRRLRNMYGLALAAETFGSKFFANDARPSVILETPAKMKEDAQQNLVKSLYEKFSGAENKWKVLVLEEGAKMHTVQMPLEDAQFLQTREMQDERICGEFGVPPHMVGLQTKSTSWGTGIEQQDIGFAKHTILPWCRKIEMELSRKLFAGTNFYARFSLEGLMRGAFKERMEGYQIGVQNGIYLRNEVRALEDMPPVDEGDVALVPANMTTMKQLQQPKPAPKEAAEDPPDRATHVTVSPVINMPETVTHKVKHTHEHPDIKELAAATATSGRQMATAVAGVGDRIASAQKNVAAGMKDVAKQGAD